MIRHSRKSYAQLVVALLLSAALGGLYSGCAGNPVNENDPASLLKDAEEDITSDHYQMALEKLKTIKNKFPYSKVAVDAQLRIADVYYLQELWPEAASAYDSFRDLHPKHEKVAYAMFRLAKAYFNDIPSPIARDLGPANKAVDAFTEFLARFPAAAESAEAKDDLAKSREALADKELYIADFYFKRDFYESAKGRYQKILALYPDSKAATSAKDKLAIAVAHLPQTKTEDPANGANSSLNSPAAPH